MTPTDTVLRRGDYVRLTIGEWAIDAFVGLASENGRSLMLFFDGAAPVGGGFALGMLPVLQDEDGTLARDRAQHAGADRAEGVQLGRAFPVGLAYTLGMEIKPLSIVSEVG